MEKTEHEPTEIQLTDIQKTHSERKKRVLVIDDCEDMLLLSTTILEIDNYDVFTALSGNTALKLLAEIARPDLILLDMYMADMSGLEFLSALEETRPDLLETVPVVFVTALDKVPTSKAVGFIRKPYDFDHFLAAVHGFIERGANVCTRHFN